MTTTPTTTTTPKPKRKRYIGPQNQTMRVLANHWNALSGADKSTWKTLSGQRVQTNQNGLPSKVGPYATFVGMNSLVMAAGGVPQSTAPSAPAPPPPLYPVTLRATYGPGGLSLSVSSSAPYPGTVLVYGLRPQLAGTDYLSSTKFKQLGSVPALSASTDLSALYLARFHVPSDGYQIAIKLVGITASGLQTHPLTLAAIAAAPAVQATATEDMELNKAA